MPRALFTLHLSSLPAILTIDGVGEWSTCSYGKGQGNRLDLLAEMVFPHSLGSSYSAFTYYTGFKVNSGEYKVMGLAPIRATALYPKNTGRIRGPAPRWVTRLNLSTSTSVRGYHDQRGL